MPNSYTEQEQLLIVLFQALVNDIRYSNNFIFGLLKEVTLSKKVIVDIDGARLELSASDNDQYTLHINSVDALAHASFISKGDYLREVVAGTITLDHAISSNKILLKGALEDLLGIYRLVVGLLVEGPTSPHLRALWDSFDKNWPQTVPLGMLIDLDVQQVSDYFTDLDVNAEIKNVEITY
ncbi:hypothetical protein WIW50_10230 [Flavobacteriaceae bacterium 3-367]